MSQPDPSKVFRKDRRVDIFPYLVAKLVKMSESLFPETEK